MPRKKGKKKGKGKKSKLGNYLRIGDVAPQFITESTQGNINWHEYIEGSWAILFSHPKDFTPVCTTEIGAVAALRSEWESRNCRVAVVSVDSAQDHKAWAVEIEKVTGNNVWYPILEDVTKQIALQYGMLDQTHLDQEGLPLTVRSVFIIAPDKKIKLILTYPASTGRNFSEIIRCLDSLQLTAEKMCATPANWKQGDRVVLLPNISDEDAAKYEGMEVVSASCKIRTIPASSV